ncbi:transcriptional regulator BetI [Enhygromyxa salina]|uniref:Transcriptional regulator BetI n=1 Tax=Enhygromyxa salina TaxID=215803 RepID=A0A2S9Y4H6_9BACT|nr:TetR/AcrR family transcriptional regulator [Enhygromyxa salina]PRQ00004.1 transcriptional regulator BetI [Enhygromyxa salina]
MRKALVEAAIDLFAAEGDAPLRAVAGRAGVNHGLVHHYLGGKAGLRAAVLQRLSASLYRSLEVPPGSSLREVGLAALRMTESDPRFVKILARALLDGDLPEQLQTAFPVVARLREAAPGDLEAARAGIAEGLALGLGALVFGPWIRAALELSEAQFEAARDGALERIFARLDAQSPRTEAV